ncbi:hypothetical protein IGI04_019939, partial [Brassica rapa subsp. trilocularis]
MECKQCNNEIDSINHVLFECIPAQDILRIVNFPPSTTPARSLGDNMSIALELMHDCSITRDHQVDVLHHARDAFTPSPNRLTAELRCIIWSLRSLGDLGFKDVVIGVDNQEAIKEISNASAWPRYRSFLDTIA